MEIRNDYFLLIENAGKYLHSPARHGCGIQVIQQNIILIIYDVTFYNSTASTWTLATPRTTWESVLSLPLPETSVPGTA